LVHQENKNTSQLPYCRVCLDALHQIRQEESVEVPLLLIHPNYEMSEHQEILAIESLLRKLEWSIIFYGYYSN
jgi:hypothetical protein